MPATDVLAKICADKRHHIAHRKTKISLQSLEDMAKQQEAPRGFQKALQQKVAAGHFGLIAEIKRASPSKGMIREDFDPIAIAQAYHTAGASCLSVLTDQPYFKGEDSYVTDVRKAVPLPLLRKDFMLDPYQIVEARAIGADCILLIMAALDDQQAQDLETLSHTLGMDVLIEVHNREELDRALTHLRSPLIGINNRNLKTLEIDLSTTEDLVKFIPEGKVIVSESGLYSNDDLQRMNQVDVSCFLVGESLMRQQDIVAATRSLLAKGPMMSKPQQPS